MRSPQEREVLEVEVERLPEAAAAADPPRGAAAKRPLHPLVAGLVIDLVDLATLGALGVYVGLPVGLVVGYQLGRRMGMDARRSLGLGAVCGVYCALPMTSPIPLGTLVGAYRAFDSRA